MRFVPRIRKTVDHNVRYKTGTPLTHIPNGLVEPAGYCENTHIQELRVRPASIVWPAFAAGLSLAAAATAAVAQQPSRPLNNGGLPAVSPDGRHIAFISNRDGTSDIYVIGVDGGAATRLTNSPDNEGAPAWTADGKSIVYSVFANGSSKLFTVPLAGGAATQIGTAPNRGPVLTKGGKRVLSTPGVFPKTALIESDLDGGNVRVLSDSNRMIFNMVTSPDGKWIAYASADSTRNMQVWLAAADGRGARVLTNFSDADGHPQWPSWSPDGRTIAVQAGKYNREKPTESSAHIWLVDVATGKATKLAAHDRPYLDETPSFFPDGKRIAIQSDRSGRMELWIINVDGTGARQITR
jgi:Tol biopolymer transport system component